jgi:dipeptidyl aminopeptidase/acylaminoacyl peptidase
MKQFGLGFAVAVILLGGCSASKVVLIESDPSQAEVAIDGVAVGKTPLSKELEFPPEKPGYQVSFSLAGYFDDEIAIAFEPKELTKYSVDLKKLSKKVEIHSSPERSTLYVNGKEVGFTPYLDTLYFDQSQEYKFTARLPMYKDGEIVVAFEPQERSHYTVELEEVEEMELELYDYEVQKRRGVVTRVHKPRLARSLKEIIERSPNVKSVSKITNYNDRTMTVGAPDLSPDGKTLAYSLTAKKEVSKEHAAHGDEHDPESGKYIRVNSNIWKQAPESTTRTRVTFGNYLDEDPTFDPSGQFIYFSSTRNTQTPSLWRVGAGGAGGITKMSFGQSEDFAPTACEDLVAFASIIPNAEDLQIWTVGANGNLLTQLREGEGPDFSADGQKILFVRKDERTSNRQIWRMDFDGGSETILSNDPEVEDFDPRWSPDGRYIVFTSDAGRDLSNKRNRDVWIMRADGSGRTQLTTNGSEDDKPCWDPAGRYVYFRSTRGFQSNIWRFELSSPTL